MKVAIVYDRVNKWGGAERVLLAMHEMFPEAPLYTSVYSEKHAKWAEVFPSVHTSFLQKIPFTRKRHEMLPLFMPLAFESMKFDQYDLVISVTSEAAKGIITKGKTKHLCYCLTPTRYLWSGYGEYFGIRDVGGFRGVRGKALRQLSKPAVEHLRRWDKIASTRPDIMVGISREVQDRIRKYYGREAEIIFPLTEVERFSLGDKTNRSNKSHVSKNYFLIVSRLVPYKKVDLAVAAFNELGLPLVIVGKGSQEKKLKRMAKGNIRFVQNVTDNELSTYYANAKGFVFPQEEDFGLVAIEAQAAGLPVIAFRKGGSLDTVIEGKTGIFFDEQRKESLTEAIRTFGNLRFLRKDLIGNARRFSKERFRKEFLKVVGKYF